MAGSETVTVLRPPAKDGFGNRSASSPAQWDVPGWQFAPGTSQEAGEGSGQVDTAGTLYGPQVTDIAQIVPGGIQPTDQIVVRGDTYDVVGRVQDWGSSGCVIVLRRVTG